MAPLLPLAIAFSIGAAFGAGATIGAQKAKNLKFTKFKVQNAGNSKKVTKEKDKNKDKKSSKTTKETEKTETEKA